MIIQTAWLNTVGEVGEGYDLADLEYRIAATWGESKNRNGIVESLTDIY